MQNLNPYRKNYIGISRDHSGSMSNLRVTATKDYNGLISDIRDGSNKEGIDTVVSVIKCGSGYAAQNLWEVQNSSVNAIRELEHQNYDTTGSQTPLFDSIGELIDALERVPDVSDPNVSFLVMAITDGYNNCNRIWNSTTLRNKIEKLQRTDRWTFLFRVPKGTYKRELSAALGVPEGNILEWDLNERGMQASSQATKVGIQTYYANRAKGIGATKSFFTADLSTIKKADVQSALVDISRDVVIWNVNTIGEGKAGIKPFCESKLMARPFKKGAAFYELVKYEKAVQDHKLIVVRDKKSGKVYYGNAARDLLGIPTYGTIKLKPAGSGDYEVFIQSTSTNRILPIDSKVLYWDNVGL
jgi:hypothetical protein